MTDNNFVFKEELLLDYINNNSGYISKLNFKNNLSEFDFFQASPNKKDIKFNFNIHKNDLAMIDVIAERLNLKRSDIVGHLFSRWVVILFNSLPEYDRNLLSNMIDNKLTDNNLNHHYRGQTWLWQMLGLDVTDDASLADVMFDKNESLYKGGYFND